MKFEPINPPSREAPDSTTPRKLVVTENNLIDSQRDILDVTSKFSFTEAKATWISAPELKFFYTVRTVDEGCATCQNWIGDIMKAYLKITIGNNTPGEASNDKTFFLFLRLSLKGFQTTLIHLG